MGAGHLSAKFKSTYGHADTRYCTFDMAYGFMLQIIYATGFSASVRIKL